VTDGEGLSNLAIGVTGVARCLIAHEQDTGDQIMLGWGSACVHHRLQPLALLLVLTRERGVWKKRCILPRAQRIEASRVGRVTSS